MRRVEVFSLGDELLRGVVADTNSGWIAQRIAARGASLERVTTLPDSPPLIADEIRAAIAREPDLIVTHGGLGPTDDDRTRDAIALATGRGLVPDADAEAVVRRRYASLAGDGYMADAALTPARLRMSLLPEGALALDNQLGAAPGLLLPLGRSSVVCLPGVPPELWWIWEHSLAPHLDRILGPGGFAEITVTLDLYDESGIADALRDIAERNPAVYVKSRATSFDQPDPRVRLTLTAAGADDATARGFVDAAFADAVATLGALGVRVADGPSTMGRNATT